jgi:iron complex outermembrane receptor protein
VVRGIVVTAGAEKPIQAALVRVVGGHASEYTHADGTFLLARVPAGEQRLLVSAIGYRSSIITITVRGGDTVSTRAVMTEAVLQLEELVTTGTVSSRARSEVLSPTSVVSGASLDRQLDGTVAGTLRHEPGVAMGGISPATAQPVIRGLGGDRVVILQDGLRPGDLASTSADHAITIDPLNAKQIEVVRGPMSLLYGSSALGGVVNVIRDEIPTTLPDGTHGVVSAQASSVNRGGAVGGFASAGLGRLAVRAEATFRGAGDTRTPVGRMVNTQATTIDAGGSLSYVGARGHAGLAYRYYDNDYGIPGGFVGGHDTGVDIAMSRHTIRGSAELHPSGTRWASVKADGGVTLYRHTEFEPSGAVGTRFRQTFGSGNLIAKHDGWLGATSGAVGIAGHYRYIRTGGTLRTPTTEDVSAAAFLVQEYGDGPLRVQAGLRFDLAHYSPKRSGTVNVGTEQVPIVPRTFRSFSGSIGALYDLGDGLKLGASVARAYRTPDFNELYSNGPHLAANSYDVGDPRLNAEAGVGVDGFVRFDRARMRAEVAVFRNSLSNYIFPSSRGRAVIGRVGGRPLFQFTNEAARFSGVEGSLGLAITDRLIFETTASYVAARFTSDRAPIPIIEPPDTSFVAASIHPPFIPPFYGHAELRYERPKYFFGAGARWASDQRRLGDFETRTPGYAVADLHAGLRVLIGGQFHTFTLRVDNAANTEYRDHLSRIKEILPQPGRNVSLLYRMAF